MKKVTAPAGSSQAPADAVVNKRDHRKEQTASGDSGINDAVNGQAVGTYSDPQGTVYIDRDSHAGAWVRFLRDMV